KPRPLPLCVDGVPKSLQVERRWVVWKYVWKGKETNWTKIPFVATAPDIGASSTDPATWRSFGEALAAYDDGQCDGPGFVLGDGYVGFDSDNSGSPEHVRLLNTYTERSPS